MAQVNSDVISDSDWIRQGLLLPEGAIEEDDMYYRTFTSAYYKYTDTTMGGNFAINAPPQYCNHGDPILKRYVDIGEGMGHFYSENIDDNAVLLHMRFGIPIFNSLSSFFSNFYSSDDSRLVRTGRGQSIGTLIGKALGWAFSVRFVPYILTFSALKWFSGTVSTKFYYLKPEMGLYWKYVNDFANTIGTNLDMVAQPADAWLQLANTADLNGTAGMETDPGTSSLEAAAKNAFQVGARERQAYDAMIPPVYRSEGLTGIDVYAVASRAQAYADAWHNAVNQIAANNQSNGNGVVGAIYNWMTFGGASATLGRARRKEYATTEDFLDAYFKESDGQLRPVVTVSTGGASGDTTANTAAPTSGGEATIDTTAPVTATDENGNPVNDPGMMESLGNSIEAAYESVKDYFSSDTLERAWATFKAAQHDGTQWVSFRIDGRQSANESFSNSVRASDLESAINSTSERARSMRFKFADGNFSDIPGIGMIMDTMKDIVSGVADSLHISGLGVLAGNAFADIPKHYDTSSATFNQMSITIPLRAWCADNVVRFQNEILPLVMLLCGVLPRATGAATYGQPFIGEFYCQGRCSIPLGMITAVDITRATSNMPWTQNGEYLGVDVRLTITDLSSVMSMPMNEAFGLRSFDPTNWSRMLFPQDSSYGSYTSVLSSLDLQTQVYMLSRFKRNWNRNLAAFDKFFSYSNVVNTIFSGNRVGSLLSALSRTDRGL